MVAVLLARAADELHPEADAEQRLALFADELVEHGREPAGAQPLHGDPEGADARQHDALRLSKRVVVARDHGPLPDRGESSLHGAQIAHPIVDDRDHAPAARAGWAGEIFIITSPFSSRTIRPFSSVVKIALFVKASSVS